MDVSCEGLQLATIFISHLEWAHFYERVKYKIVKEYRQSSTEKDKYHESILVEK